jgi:hypothetical protein
LSVQSLCFASSFQGASHDKLFEVPIYGALFLHLL